MVVSYNQARSVNEILTFNKELNKLSLLGDIKSAIKEIAIFPLIFFFDMDKIIFLDIDGVLNSHRTLVAYGKFSCFTMDDFEKYLDPTALALLQRLQSRGVDFVLSSTWRINTSTKEDLLNFGNKLGIEFHSITPFVFDGTRGNEISAWFSNNEIDPGKVKYVIIDDDDDMLEEQMDNLVHICPKEGFIFKDYEKTCELLGLDVYP